MGENANYPQLASHCNFFTCHIFQPGTFCSKVRLRSQCTLPSIVVDVQQIDKSVTGVVLSSFIAFFLARVSYLTVYQYVLLFQLMGHVVDKLLPPCMTLCYLLKESGSSDLSSVRDKILYLLNQSLFNK